MRKLKSKSKCNYKRPTQTSAPNGGVGIVDEAATAPLSNDAAYYGTLKRGAINKPNTGNVAVFGENRPVAPTRPFYLSFPQYFSGREAVGEIMIWGVSLYDLAYGMVRDGVDPLKSFDFRG